MATTKRSPRTTDPMILAFCKSLNQNPNDSAARGAFADWLDEQGLPGARTQRQLYDLTWNACLSGFLEALRPKRRTYSWDTKAPRGFIRVLRIYAVASGNARTPVFYVRKLDGGIFRPEGYGSKKPGKRPLKHGLAAYWGRGQKA